MILDFDSYIINESSLKKLKRQVHGVLDMKSRKRMRKELRDNIITFKFKKRNGEIRTAHGTLHPSYLPKLKGGAPRPEHQMVYYDLDKEGWRSFRSFTFIKILNIKPVDTTVKPKPVPEKEEEEDIKKTVPTKETEKEMEKETHTEEKEDKKKVREIDDKIEDDDDKKSILDDKDTPEEEEVIKKDNEEDEDEDKKKDKDKESEDE